MLGLLGTLGRIAQAVAPVLKVFQPIIQAVQRVVQQVTQPSSSAASGSNPSSSGATSGKTQATTTRKTSSPPSRPSSGNGDTPLATRSSALQDIRATQGGYVQPTIFPAELTVLAIGNRLAQDVLLALKHESKPDNVSDDVWLKRFALYGQEEADNDQAKQLLNLHKQSFKQSDTPPTITLSDVLNERVAEINQQLASTSSDQVASHLYSHLTDINNLTANSAYLADPKMYQKALQIAFGYNIDLVGNTGIQALTRLGDASLDIVKYINQVQSNANIEGDLAIFDKFFSENGAVTVHLGAEQQQNPRVDAASGLTPLQVYFTDANGNKKLNFDTYNMYLGSATTVSTIVHEFGHQLDRSFILQNERSGSTGGLTQDLTSIQGGFSQFYNVTNQVSNLDINVPRNLIQGFAAKQFLPPEYFADLFMTAVLSDNSQPPGSFSVYSLQLSNATITRQGRVPEAPTSQDFRDLETFGSGVFFSCSSGQAMSNVILADGTKVVWTIPCGESPVGWANPDVGNEFNTYLSSKLR